MKYVLIITNEDEHVVYDGTFLSLSELSKTVHELLNKEEKIIIKRMNDRLKNEIAYESTFTLSPDLSSAVQEIIKENEQVVLKRIHELLKNGVKRIWHSQS